MVKDAEPVRTTLRLDPQLKAAVEAAAQAERRTFTAQVELILAEWLEARKKQRKAK